MFIACCSLPPGGIRQVAAVHKGGWCAFLSPRRHKGKQLFSLCGLKLPEMPKLPKIPKIEQLPPGRSTTRIAESKIPAIFGNPGNSGNLKVRLPKLLLQFRYIFNKLRSLSPGKSPKSRKL